MIDKSNPEWPSGEVERANIHRAPEAYNHRIFIKMALELEKAHALPPSAIARILHVEEGWVEMILKENGRERGQS
jgi:hypothetical protein